MPFFDFMASVPSGPENLERLGVHLLPFQVERPLERLPVFPSEIVVPSRWNGRNGNIVPFQCFFYVLNLERQPACRAARCTASRCDWSVTAPACGPWAAGRADAAGSHHKGLRATFERWAWGHSQGRAETLVGRFRAVGGLPLVGVTGSVSAAMGNRFRHAKSARKCLICNGSFPGPASAGNSHRALSLVGTNV